LSADRVTPVACARREVFPVQPWELRLLRRAAGCRPARTIRDDLLAAAEIFPEDRLDAADRSDEFVPVQQRGAFLVERRVAPDIGRAVPDELEISELLAARLPVWVSRELLLEHPRDLPPQGAALEARRASEPSLKERLRAAPRSSDASSDVPALQPVPSEPRQAAKAHPQATQRALAELWCFAMAFQEWKALCAEAPLPAQPALLREPPQEQERAARSSLSQQRFSLPPPPLLLPPVRENAFAPARRARCQSNSSASSFP
jgi:hypothetical protein